MIIIHQNALFGLSAATISELIDASEVRVLYACGTVQDFTDAFDLLEARNRIRQLQSA